MADEDLFDEADDDGESSLGAFADAGNLYERDRGQRQFTGKGPAEKRAGGRPRGALNRKTKDFERYYAAKGFKDPLVAQAQFLTADPVELQAWFIEHERSRTGIGAGLTAKAVPSLIEIIKEQHAVASVLAPYLHGKKPVQVEIIDERLPTLIVDLGTNQLDEGRKIAGQRALSIGRPVIEENQALGIEPDGSSHDAASHEYAKPLNAKED